MTVEVRLTPDEIEACEEIAAQHGLPFLLDHLGLDGLGNTVVDVHQRVERLEAALRPFVPDIPGLYELTGTVGLQVGVGDLTQARDALASKEDKSPESGGPLMADQYEDIYHELPPTEDFDDVAVLVGLVVFGAGLIVGMAMMGFVWWAL